MSTCRLEMLLYLAACIKYTAADESMTCPVGYTISWLVCLEFHLTGGSERAH